MLNTSILKYTEAACVCYKIHTYVSDKDLKHMTAAFWMVNNSNSNTCWKSLSQSISNTVNIKHSQYQTQSISNTVNIKHSQYQTQTIMAQLASSLVLGTFFSKLRSVSLSNL